MIALKPSVLLCLIWWTIGEKNGRHESFIVHYNFYVIQESEIWLFIYREKLANGATQIRFYHKIELLLSYHRPVKLAGVADQGCRREQGLCISHVHLFAPRQFGDIHKQHRSHKNSMDWSYFSSLLPPSANHCHSRRQLQGRGFQICHYLNFL